MVRRHNPVGSLLRCKGGATPTRRGGPTGDAAIIAASGPFGPGGTMAHTTRVGDVEVLSLLDVGEWKLGNFFPTVPADVWEEYRAIYPDALCDGNAICTSATAYAVRANNSVILIDTGLGPGPHERIGGQAGQLLDELKSLGIRPDD